MTKQIYTHNSQYLISILTSCRKQNYKWIISSKFYQGFLIDMKFSGQFKMQMSWHLFV